MSKKLSAKYYQENKENISKSSLGMKRKKPTIWA